MTPNLVPPLGLSLPERHLIGVSLPGRHLIGVLHAAHPSFA